MIQMLFGAFPSANATPTNIAAYLETLDEVPLDELRVVVKQCMREGGSFPPSAGQVLERWRQMRNGTTAASNAAQGWLSVQRALRDPATYTPEPSSFVPQFKDPIVKKAVEALGWYNLRMSENPRTDQAQFERLYKMFVEQEANEQRLSGEYRQLRDEHTERTDSGSGLVRIGDVLRLNGSEN